MALMVQNGKQSNGSVDAVPHPSQKDAWPTAASAKNGNKDFNTSSPGGDELSSLARTNNSAAKRAGLGGSGNGGTSQEQISPSEVDGLGTRINLATAGRIGIRGWARALRIVYVLGSLAVYLNLENYDVRAKFARRHREMLLKAASAEGRLPYAIEWFRYIRWLLLDLLIRAFRLLVFRGTAGSTAKEKRERRQAAWVKQRLIGLGPTFIKIGQALGTRADLLPLAYVKELATLQDQVPPFPTAQAFARIEAELGRPILEAFREIDPIPVASASLGQVYRAHLHSGEEVAIKVQRPDLERAVSFDLSVLGALTRALSRFPHFSENADWEGMLREFSATISEEMDYELEGRNADRFRQNFKEWRAVHVPKIYWSHTTRLVLTIEFVHGTKVLDVEKLKSKRISPPKVNRLLVQTYLKQLLEDGFFHADPHPGNLLVMDDGRLAFFDFGMTGRISAQLQSTMIDAFFHVVERNVPALAQDLINLDFLKPGIDPGQIRPVVENLFQHYLGLKLGEVNFNELTYQLAEVVYDYPFRLPANFTYIIRALMTLEGIAIVTDPQFSFFETAKPFAKEFMLRREGREFRKRLFDRITGRNEGRIDWPRVWKLARMAARSYFAR